LLVFCRSVPELGSWNVTKALMLTGSSGADISTNWQGTAKILSGTQVSYKFIKLQTDGTPVWEDDPNRDFQTPSTCGRSTTGSSSSMQEGGKWHDGTVVAPACTSVDVQTWTALYLRRQTVSCDCHLAWQAFPFLPKFAAKHQ